MLFHTFGAENERVVVLIHGMLTPWQIWQTAADRLSEKYRVILPELDAHTQDEPSVFESIESEAEEIKDRLFGECGGKVYAICGLSMGGRIAAVLAGLPGIHTEYLVLDGAPLVKMPGIVKGFMKINYNDLIKRSKKRDPKVIENFKKSFLPEKYLESYMKIADNMDRQSVDNIIDSVFDEFEFPKYDDECKILFMHGTKGNESAAKRSAVRMKAVNPDTTIKCFDGYAHAQLASFEEERWASEVAKFLDT